MKTINIKSQQRNYQILIKDNLLENLNDYLEADRFYVIISDDIIPNKYIDLVETATKSNNLLIRFPSGENSKSFFEYQRIITILQKNEIKRDACIIALGGGVTGDLAGFVASTYLRGIDYIQIPTSLLAQIDSSVGGKVAINTDAAKNSIGSFYPPLKVLIDPRTLETLPIRHFNNGMGEMIKYGMIHSKSFFEEILNQDVHKNLEHFIYHSLQIKQYYVENDEYDNSIRQILNFGHTYGHAYEAYFKFNKYLHGEAVALGMLKACKKDKVRDMLIRVLNKYNLPVDEPINDEKVLPYIKKDKKNTKDFLNMILVDKIGEAYIQKEIYKGV